MTEYPQIQYTIKFSDFMKQIGAKCILDEEYTYSEKELLGIAQINRTYENLNTILGYIASIMKKLEYAFLIDSDSRELIIYRWKDQAIRTIQISRLLDGYNKHILDP